tara:strand:+ start:584 stop:790 length:207 start_codon:yes stop_codon:yes gene_type:complete
MKKYIDEMYPNRVILYVKEVLKCCEFSESTYQRLRRSGEFPQPIQISSRRIGHPKNDVIKYLEGRVCQ